MIPWREDDGAVAVIVALFAVVLFGFAALVVDIGNAFNVRTLAQHAVDAGALAGVHKLVVDEGATDPDVLKATVETYVSENIPVSAADWSGCVDGGGVADGLHPIPGSPCISYRVPADPPPGSGYEVRVQFPNRQVAATFAGIFGVGSIRVAPVAAAGEGLIPYSPCEPCSPVLNTSGQPVSDPTLPSPLDTWRVPAMTDNPSPVGPLDCPVPGRYKDLVINTDCDHLSAGLYVFDNSSLNVSGALTAPDAASGPGGVTLVFYGSGTITVGGQLKLTATPPGAGAVANEIPGVVIVIATDPTGPSSVDTRPFDLGPNFELIGSVFAINGEWVTTNANDCGATATPKCHLDAATVARPSPDDNDGVLAVAKTSFAAGIPTVKSNRPPPIPPADKSLHLVR